MALRQPTDSLTLSKLIVNGNIGEVVELIGKECEDRASEERSKGGAAGSITQVKDKSYSKAAELLGAAAVLLRRDCR